MSGKNINVIIMAAGEGTRMKSTLPKVLHKAAGRSLLEWVVDATSSVTKRPIVIYGSGGDVIPHTFGARHEYVLQNERLGTGHAVMVAREALKVGGGSHTLVIAGDMPLVRKQTIQDLVDYTIQTDAELAILTARPAVTPAYGRIVRDDAGNICRIVEERDATEEERAIKELNFSVYCFKTEALLMALDELKPENVQNEYYLTDTIGILYEKGMLVVSKEIEDLQECMGVNNRAELAQVATVLRSRINHGHMMAGVTMIDPAATYIDADVVIGPDTLIYPGVILEGQTDIGEGCILYQGSRITNSEVCDGVTVENSVLQDAIVGKNSTVGPYAFLRPGTIVGEDCRIGDYVELKNAVVGNGTKISHLTYVGDAELGEDINIGCGVVFVNYDGKEKFVTKVGDRAFIGCNTNLVSPVNVGEGAYIAAGSTVTKDVPKDALVIARAREVIKDGWGKGRYKDE